MHIRDNIVIDVKRVRRLMNSAFFDFARRPPRIIHKVCKQKTVEKHVNFTGPDKQYARSIMSRVLCQL